MKVFKPERLKRHIFDKARNTTELYERELNPAEMGNKLRKNAGRRAFQSRPLYLDKRQLIEVQISLFRLPQLA
jgi:hypothetical protein